ncbi:MAG: class I SAM-dependent methyltransferase [Bacteroidetes bacterium]|nr:class I SAM-dependent methyltransferase [Bacteroidota bacterium]
MPASDQSKQKSPRKPISYLLSLLNPVRIFRALQFHRKQKKYCKVSHDQELRFYSEMLSNEMLHYGYFENADIEPEKLSFHDVETAQLNYAEKLISHLADKSLPVLDIGCGIGGIANLLSKKGFKVDVLSPNISQLNYVKKKHPGLQAYNVKFEELKADKKYGSLLNAESFQYIDIEKGFAKADELIIPGGRWVICDYFPIMAGNEKLSGRRFEDFEKLAVEHGWKIIYHEDITKHVLPTLRFVNMYIIRIVNPLLFYLENKMLVKMAWLHHLTHEIRESLDKKLRKEFSKIDIETFLAEKKYLIVVLTK